MLTGVPNKSRNCVANYENKAITKNVLDDASNNTVLKTPVRQLLSGTYSRKNKTVWAVNVLLFW